MKEYSVLQRLPNPGEKVMCFGHATHCCSSDMDEEPAWHEVIFDMVFSEYKVKLEIPKDPEESIFDYCHYREYWEINEYEQDNGHVIGVTKWKRM